MSCKPFATKVASLFPCSAKDDPLPRGLRLLLPWTLEVSHIEYLHGGPKVTRDKGRQPTYLRDELILALPGEAVLLDHVIIVLKRVGKPAPELGLPLEGFTACKDIIEIDVPKLSGRLFQLYDAVLPGNRRVIAKDR